MGQSELISLDLPDERRCEAVGQQLVTAMLKCLPPDRAFVVNLTGALGTGKTTLARAMLRGAGIGGQIRSPTYTLVETYDSPDAIQFVHIDLYRIAGLADASGLGLREYDRPATIWLVEWPERAAVASTVDIDIELIYRLPGRQILFSGRTAAGRHAVSDAGLVRS